MDVTLLRNTPLISEMAGNSLSIPIKVYKDDYTAHSLTSEYVNAYVFDKSEAVIVATLTPALSGNTITLTASSSALSGLSGIYGIAVEIRYPTTNKVDKIYLSLYYN